MKEHYELLYIVSIKHLEADLKKVMETVAGLIKKEGGVITHNNVIGRQKLAYPINNIHQGTYVEVEFDVEQKDGIKRLESQLQIMKEMLRFLIVVKKQKTAEQVNRELALKEKLRQETEKELVKADKPAPITIKRVDVPKEETPAIAPVKTEAKAEPKAEPETSKMDLDDIDKKLDKILSDDLL